MNETPVVSIYVRHSVDCPYKGDESHRGCRCRKHLRWHYRGEQFRVSAKTRSWGEAEKAAKAKESEFGGGVVAAQVPERITIQEAVDSFLTRKRTEGVTSGVLGKYTRELARLQKFFSNRNKFWPADMTLPRLEEFRAGWATDYPSSYTRQKVQERLKGFLNYCRDAGWIALVPKLSAIRVTEPPTMPLSDKEYETLLSKIPVVFRDARKIQRVRALMQMMRHSGLAIGDSVTLERNELRK